MYKKNLSEYDANKFMAVTSATEEADVSSMGSIKNKEEKPTMYAWFVLFLVFAIRAVHQMHRQVIGFAFGYQAIGNKFNSPDYMITAAYP